ncbi:hypothetical protein GGTG_10279 [Gaeumannomyces tritici R3-111a-1]|uniref:Uncharacterized protein n=1 Tax=Gaeumannomyces tritici (strain R3-111a-1) TaxID=644352 RepID=J3P9V5_GAET3|nr:hypothetical protein GGTG_10279 [Gaeumannomyces tritici R3-111a-1]EJT73441.1 hypothetical protein GGTG_10279 [Gaeumannomyces tritici R3-111a-1]
MSTSISGGHVDVQNTYLPPYSVQVARHQTSVTTLGTSTWVPKSHVTAWQPSGRWHSAPLGVSSAPPLRMKLWLGSPTSHVVIGGD